MIKLPPTEFSNAINFIYKDFDFTNWEESKEWRLFNAGRESEALKISAYAKLEVSDLKWR
jgi:RNA recognition motif-containing protein